MTLSGLLGVPTGSWVSQRIRHRVPNADPLVCAVTLLCSVPILFFGFISANYSLPLCYGLTFFAGIKMDFLFSRKRNQLTLCHLMSTVAEVERLLPFLNSVMIYIYFVLKVSYWMPIGPLYLTWLYTLLYQQGEVKCISSSIIKVTEES